MCYRRFIKRATLIGCFFCVLFVLFFNNTFKHFITLLTTVTLNIGITTIRVTFITYKYIFMSNTFICKITLVLLIVLINLLEKMAIFQRLFFKILICVASVAKKVKNVFDENIIKYKYI